jgi:hypothetical protein
LNLWVILSQLLLLVREVVEAALVALSVTVLLAENEPALAGNLYQSHLLGALPAFVQVALNIIWLGLTDKTEIYSTSPSN